jgi:hypothetical protein
MQMDKSRFSAVLPIFVASLIDKIANDFHLSEEEAIEKLYSSKLYAFLEDEETKVWHFSTEKLYDLFREEMKTGKIDFPEY